MERAPAPLLPTRLPVPLIRFDPGWLFLISGIAAIVLTVIIPARRNLEDTRWERDKALSVEAQRQQRVKNYQEYLAALDRQDEAVMLSLASVQLTKSPAERVPLLDPPDPGKHSASVFPSLEPGAVRELAHPASNRRVSALERWSTNAQTRLWILALGVMCVLIGLLPASRPAGDVERAAGA